MSVGDESCLSSYLRIGERSWWEIPLLALICFHISVEQV